VLLRKDSSLNFSLPLLIAVVKPSHRDLPDNGFQVDCSNVQGTRPFLKLQQSALWGNLIELYWAKCFKQNSGHCGLLLRHTKYYLLQSNTSLWLETGKSNLSCTRPWFIYEMVQQYRSSKWKFWIMCVYWSEISIERKRILWKFIKTCVRRRVHIFLSVNFMWYWKHELGTE
jgi:hypothetical protein